MEYEPRVREKLGGMVRFLEGVERERELAREAAAVLVLARAELELGTHYVLVLLRWVSR